MRYREKLNIIFMRDNGPRHSIKIRRSNFILLAFIFGCLPFLCLLLLAECWVLWQENSTLSGSMEKLEAEFQALSIRAERLENLEALLEEEKIPGREIVIEQLAAQPAAMEEDKPAAFPLEEISGNAEGPGHEEFPALDSGRVKVGNVQVRAINDSSVRIGLDLRNPDNEPILSGEVQAVLVTANGERHPLKFSQEEIGAFRISRFKHTVMIANLPNTANIENSQLIIEVRDQNQKPLFRNIYGVQR